ncbi:MAG: hypothetical protein NZ455_05035 [Bacteroidia bacterium]|nr:hypothetical protein [Bacteroidia bacterium]MDW8346448.1 hypothetical protein [Bacteroidia bacterium]
MITSIKQGKANVGIKKIKHQNAACVRDTEHAVRQCEAQRSTKAIAECEVARPEAQRRDTPKKR